MSNQSGAATGEGTSEPDSRRLAIDCIAQVVGMSSDELRGDSPLRDLGADDIALVQWADLLELQILTDHCLHVHIPDDGLQRAVVIADLATLVESALTASQPARLTTGKGQP